MVFTTYALPSRMLVFRDYQGRTALTPYSRSAQTGLGTTYKLTRGLSVRPRHPEQLEEQQKVLDLDLGHSANGSSGDLAVQGDQWFALDVELSDSRERYAMKYRADVFDVQPATLPTSSAATFSP